MGSQRLRLVSLLFEDKMTSKGDFSVMYSNDGICEVSGKYQEYGQCFEGESCRLFSHPSLIVCVLLVDDVIGCGYQHSTRELFFTRNGSFLGW